MKLTTNRYASGPRYSASGVPLARVSPGTIRMWREKIGKHRVNWKQHVTRITLLLIVAVGFRPYVKVHRTILTFLERLRKSAISPKAFRPVVLAVSISMNSFMISKPFLSTVQLLPILTRRSHSRSYGCPTVGASSTRQTAKRLTPQITIRLRLRAHDYWRDRRLSERNRMPHSTRRQPAASV